MATKVSGLGDNYYVGGYDLSTATQALDSISGTVAMIDSTDITQSAHSRLGGLRDGLIEWTSYFDILASTGAHAALSPLPTTDVIATYFHGTAIGNAAASCNGLQINYDPTRAADGSITFKVHVQADKYGLEWGTQLTAGLRTDTVATNGTSNDFGAASNSFGAQAYLQVTAFTGTDVTVTIQDSADNSSFANVTGGAFAQTTAAHTFQRIATANNLQIRRYVRAITTTVGGFTSATFAVQISINATSVVF